MRFSIVTPSYQSGNWLGRCMASVADQGDDLLLEHIVQDAGSQDQTRDILWAAPSRVSAFIEKDSGMYDAVNRGFLRARGEFIAHLNCDEQYLPGALRKVAAFFDAHPETDAVFADALVVDCDGRYLCHRKATLPTKLHTLLGRSLSYLTCGLFLRRRVITDHNLLFDTSYRLLGDAAWALAFIQSGLTGRLLREITSVFTATGDNLSLRPAAANEQTRIRSLAPAWASPLRPLVGIAYRLHRWRQGGYDCAPLDYSIWTPESAQNRTSFHVTHPTSRWRWKA